MCFEVLLSNELRFSSQLRFQVGYLCFQRSHLLLLLGHLFDCPGRKQASIDIGDWLSRLLPGPGSRVNRLKSPLQVKQLFVPLRNGNF